MIDLVKLKLIAGDGGHGRVSFRREKYVPKGGPDGGYGGDGGHVIIESTKHINTLKHLTGKKEITAFAGEIGGRRKKTGERGEDIVVKVPVGTVIWVEKENQPSFFRRKKYGVEYLVNKSEVELDKYFVEKEGQGIPFRESSEWLEIERVPVFTFDQPDQRVIICQGGFGGRGNVAFKSGSNTTPLEAEYGSFAEKKLVTLELKLLADIGLVGYPNAGKSTLLSKITKANPKTANYPFTTIEPNLGVLSFGAEKDVVVADIPGLIEGASEGKGLGLDFLRHVENSRVLLYVLFLEEEQLSDKNLTVVEKTALIWQQYQLLQKELKNYHPSLIKKPFVVSVNKIDLYDQELQQAIKEKFEQARVKVLLFSGFTGDGLIKLVKKLEQVLATN